MSHKGHSADNAAESTEQKPSVISSQDDGSNTDTPHDHNLAGELMVARAKPEPRGIKGLPVKIVRHKVIAGLVVVLLLVSVVFAVPVTRYKFLGLFIKRSVQITVTDSTTHLPVSNAQVTLSGISGKTNENGVVHLRVSVGTRAIHIAKQYYKDADRPVHVALSKNDVAVTLVATGRQVPVTVSNVITGVGLQGVEISSQGTSVKTDQDGRAVIVLPATEAKHSVRLALGGYNALDTSLIVTTSSVPGNQFKLTPTGRLFFLSNASGKIDVVSTNLDGSDRKVVLAGTGKEDRSNTVLLASNDWKYLALHSLRDGGEYPKLFLIEASTGKVTVMDEGKATFGLVGWSGHYFAYMVNRNLELWQPKRQAIKTFNADNKKMMLIDETQAGGTGSWDYIDSSFNMPYLHGDALVYGVSWQAGYSGCSQLPEKNASLMTARLDGTGKRSVKDFPMQGGYGYCYFGVYAQQYAPQLSLVTVSRNFGTPGTSYYKYEGTKLSDVTSDAAQQMQQGVVGYLVSPDGKSTLWSDLRDGKTAILIGDANGGNGKVAGNYEDQSAYGWYGSDYILVNKKSSELYIMSVSGGQQLKISDYYKPFQARYGYGYGGQ